MTFFKKLECTKCYCLGSKRIAIKFTEVCNGNEGPACQESRLTFTLEVMIKILANLWCYTSHAY